MTDLVVSIEDQNITATVQQLNTFVASTNLSSPATVDTLASVNDVDVVTEGLTNGSILVYKTNTNKWTSTRTLDAQNMEGGEF